MERLNRSRTVVYAFALAGLFALASVVVARGSTSAAPTLVIDNTFTIKTADPQREFDPTATIVDRAIYDTLFTYVGSDVAHPVPLLAHAWVASKDAKTLSVQLRTDAHFADGTPLTSADVVFSLHRLVNLRANPSFLLAGIAVTAKGRYGVVFRSKNPQIALTAILANPATGILNAALARKHGGRDGADAYRTDEAERWLNSAASAGVGSGPYLLKSFSTTSQVTLEPNPRYWGSRKPPFATVAVRNMIAPTQLINIQRATHEVAIDLSSTEATSLRSNPKLRVSLQPSTSSFYVFAHNDPKVSTVTSNKNFQKAVRYALDYRAFSRLAGPGTVQTPGLIPSTILGSLRTDAVRQDLAKARAALAASGIGDEQVTLEYPSDVTINGVSFASMAQKVHANLRAIGINITLSGLPVGTWLTRFRGGEMPFGIWLWIPDYPDPADYLVFAPGQLVANRVGWGKGSDPAIEKLAAKALVTTARAAREKLYREFQIELNERGPYFPLIQPKQAFVATTDLKNAVFNAYYLIDVTRVVPR